jgi:hypothetical protein
MRGERYEKGRGSIYLLLDCFLSLARALSLARSLARACARALSLSLSAPGLAESKAKAAFASTRAPL